MDGPLACYADVSGNCPSQRPSPRSANRDVALAMQHAPDIDVVSPLDIEHQIGITLNRPAPEAWQVQLITIAHRAGGGMTSDVQEGPLQHIDKRQCGQLGPLVQIGIRRPLAYPGRPEHAG